MKYSMRALGAVCSMGILAACSASKGTEPKRDAARAAIESNADAKTAFGFLKAEAEHIDGQVHTNFSGPLPIAGVAGSASVTGGKTSSVSSSLSSRFSSSSSDLNVAFADFQSSVGGAVVSGQIRWTDYSDSRTACSSYCTSASHNSQSLEGTSIELTFNYLGKTYHDRLSVDGSRNNTSSWSVDLTNGAGHKFSFSYP